MADQEEEKTNKTTERSTEQVDKDGTNKKKSMEIPEFTQQTEGRGSEIQKTDDQKSKHSAATQPDKMSNEKAKSPGEDMKKFAKSSKPKAKKAAKSPSTGGKQPSPGGAAANAQDLKNLSRFSKSLHDKNQAKKEEGEYLKLRKQQLLMDFLPKTKAARMRRSDEKFPSGALKAMEKWNFGAMKAKFMALRPNGKYATWFGKNHDEKHKHEKCITIKDRILAQRQQKPGAKGFNGLPKVQEPPKSMPPAPKGQQAVQAESQQIEALQDGDGFDEEEIMTNVRYSRPLSEKGTPFWTEEAENADTEEEEAIVNSEAVEKDGQEALRKKKGDPRGGVPFDPMANLKDLIVFDKKFEMRDVYLSTIQNVVTLWGNNEDKQQMPEPQPQKISFNAQMVCSEYELGAANIVNKKGFTSSTKEFKDVVKVTEKD